MHLLALAVSALALPRVEAPREAPTPVPIVYHERLIFVSATINGRDVLCLLDTGANRTAVDARVAQELGLQVLERSQVEGSAGVVEVGMVELASVAVGQRVAERMRATQQDLGGLLAPPDCRIGAILGSDFLQRWSLFLDYDEGELALWEEGALTAKGWHSLPMVLDNGIPRISALLVETVPADFRIDSGASLFETGDVYLNVTQRCWRELRAHDASLEPTSYLSGTGLGGSLQLPVARISNARFGPVSVAAPWVIVQPETGYFARPDAVGFVGNNFLEKHGRVVIDYPGGRLLLARSAEAGH